MKDLHYAVYLRAREYWNTRFNDIHVPLAYQHGRQLLLAYPTVDEDIVIPAILLHDVGWKSIPEEQHKGAYGPTVRDVSLIRFHETEGARIANEILSAIGYDPSKKEMIMRIVDGHDTRLEPLSEEDSVMKDADKMWRFTPVGVDYHHREFGKTLTEYVPWLACQIDRWFLTESGKQMARDSFANVEKALAEAGHV